MPIEQFSVLLVAVSLQQFMACRDNRPQFNPLLKTAMYKHQATRCSTGLYFVIPLIKKTKKKTDKQESANVSFQEKNTAL